MSCFGTKVKSAWLGALVSPFDYATWAYMGMCFTTVVLILTYMFTRYISDATFLTVGITLENSVSFSTYETRFRQKAYPTYGICTVIAIWTIFVGTLLTNWYKSIFMMEMIVPTVHESPWVSVVDVDRIRLLMPFGLLGENNRASPLDNFRYMSFYLEILYRCLKIISDPGDHKRLVRDRKTAANLVQKMTQHSAQYKNSTKGFSTVGNFTDPSPYYKIAVMDSRIQPVEYDERDSYGVIKILNTCGEVALMDTKENIAEIIDFLNDHQQKVTYVKGDGDTFFRTVRGWTLPVVRNSYVEKRLKVFISSGIITHWKVVYNLWKPTRLLGQYGNWTRKKVEAVSRLDFSSKISTGFYICGLCLVICVIVLMAENWRHNHRKFVYRIYWLIITLVREMCKLFFRAYELVQQTLFTVVIEICNRVLQLGT